MVMYSEALANAILKIGYTAELVDFKICKTLIEKIKTEATLDSAAQAVVDEIKRDYDNACKPGELDLREDLTLLVRIFDKNLKNDLILTESLNETMSTNSTLDDSTNSIEYSINQSEVNIIDKDGKIKPYIEFSQFYNNIESNSHDKYLLEQLEKDLENLDIIEDVSRL